MSDTTVSELIPIHNKFTEYLLKFCHECIDFLDFSSYFDVIHMFGNHENEFAILVFDFKFWIESSWPKS